MAYRVYDIFIGKEEMWISPENYPTRRNGRALSELLQEVINKLGTNGEKTVTLTFVSHDTHRDLRYFLLVTES